jgi:hypothetical protein
MINLKRLAIGDRTPVAAINMASNIPKRHHIINTQAITSSTAGIPVKPCETMVMNEVKNGLFKL